MAELSMTQLWAIYAFHLLLLCTLLAAALVQYDGNRPPLRLFLPAVVVGVLMPVFGPCCTPAKGWPMIDGPWTAVAGRAVVAYGSPAGGVPMSWPASIICVGLFCGAGKRPAYWRF